MGPFNTSNNSNMGSNATTVQNQGGGSKKAGLVPTMNLTMATAIAYNVRHLPQSQNVMRMNLYRNVRQSRPIYVRPANWSP
jgi:hypothetical protein